MLGMKAEKKRAKRFLDLVGKHLSKFEIGLHYTTNSSYVVGIFLENIFPLYVCSNILFGFFIFKM